MTFRFTLLSLLLLVASAARALDREVFSLTNYDLNLQVDPEQHRLGVRGKVTLRNDSQTPQKIAVLQISSSLDWRAVKAGDKTLQFVTQPYTSDIDHTGGLSEAIVTLPEPIPPKGTIELEIAYEGVVLLDATRFTRIGMKEDAASSMDWDQIDAKFTGVRGAGHVAWYPIATEVANLSEKNSSVEVLGRWNTRQAGSRMHLQIGVTGGDYETAEFLFNGVKCTEELFNQMGTRDLKADCAYQPSRWDTPTLVIAGYQLLEKPAIEVRYLHGHDAAATNFADATEKIAPFITDWFGPAREKAKTADLPDQRLLQC